jgi:hypothetical protein
MAPVAEGWTSSAFLPSGKGTLSLRFAPFGPFTEASGKGKVRVVNDHTTERTMDSAIFTLAALGALVAIGWVIDLVVHREPQTRLERLLAAQLQRSTNAIRGETVV